MPVVDLDAPQRARLLTTDEALCDSKEFGRAQQLQLLVVRCCCS